MKCFQMLGFDDVLYPCKADTEEEAGARRREGSGP